MYIVICAGLFINEIWYKSSVGKSLRSKKIVFFVHFESIY